MTQFAESGSLRQHVTATVRPVQRYVRSLGTRLAMTTSVLVLMVAGALCYVLIGHERSEQLRVKREEAVTVVKLFAELSSAAVLFGDEQDISESLQHLRSNDQVVEAAVFAWKGGAWAGTLGTMVRGSRGETLRAPHAQDVGQVQISEDALDVSRWVSDPSGQHIGATLVRFSLVQENRGFELLRMRLLQVALAGACLLNLLLWLVARFQIIQPLRAVHAAVRELSAGARTSLALAAHERRLPLQSRDEVGDLARGFVRMAQAIREREAAIAAQNSEMRLVLGTVGEGFLVLDAHGVIEGQHSAVLEKWFGPVPTGQALWHYLQQHDPKFAEWLELTWSNIGAPHMPLTLCLEQLPKTFSAEERHYEIQYHALRDGHEQLETMVVVIEDVTELRQRELAESKQRELVEVFTALVRDRAGFMNFCEDARTFIQESAQPPPSRHRAVLEQLHTLKGNAFLFKLRELGEACELVEENCTRDQRPPLREDLVFLAHALRKSISAVEPLISLERAHTIQLSSRDYLELVRALESGQPSPAVLGLLMRASAEPAEQVFSRFAERLQNLAKRLSKCSVRVLCEGSGVRFPPQRFAPLWAAAVHVLRNIADHALESTWEREHTGKPLEATVLIRAELVQDTLRITFRDDGRGVDWESVRASAQRRGLRSATQRDLVAALFAPGVSTLDERSALSGRGVGLAAVHSEVLALGGTVSFTSEKGRGSELTLELPESVLSAAII